MWKQNGSLSPWCDLRFEKSYFRCFQPSLFAGPSSNYAACAGKHGVFCDRLESSVLYCFGLSPRPGDRLTEFEFSLKFNFKKLIEVANTISVATEISSEYVRSNVIFSKTLRSVRRGPCYGREHGISPAGYSVQMPPGSGWDHGHIPSASFTARTPIGL